MNMITSRVLSEVSIAISLRSMSWLTKSGAGCAVVLSISARLETPEEGKHLLSVELRCIICILEELQDSTRDVGRNNGDQ